MNTGNITSPVATSTIVNLDQTPVVVKAKAKSKQKRSVGRPAASVKLILNKSFTLKDLQATNPNVKPVTLRAHVLRALETGTLTKLDKVVESGRKGKPAHIYCNTKVFKANQANLAKAKAKKEAVAAEPVTA